MDEGDVYVRYNMEDEHTIDLNKTFTSPNLRGRGLAGKVVEAALEHALEHKLKVIASCPYVKHYMEKEGYDEKLRK